MTCKAFWIKSAGLSVLLLILGISTARGQTYAPMLLRDDQIDHEQVVAVGVNVVPPTSATVAPKHQADALFVFTGILALNDASVLASNSPGPHIGDGWNRVELMVRLAPKAPWTSDDTKQGVRLFLGGTAVAALGKIQAGTSAAWAIDDAWVDMHPWALDPDHPGTVEYLTLHVKAAVHGLTSDGNTIFGIPFQANVVAATLRK